MREVQRDAHLIEHEMEEHFKGLLAKNEARLRNLPVSLTQEIES